MLRTFRYAMSVLMLIALTQRAVAQAPATQPATQPDALKPAGLSEIVRLWPGEPPATAPVDAGDKVTGRRGGPRPSIFVTNIRQSSLSVFLPRVAGGPTAAVVICPGGGYMGEAMYHEGFAVAQQFAERGVAAFVLKYRLPVDPDLAADHLPRPQQDVLRALQLVRANARKWNVNPKLVGVMGFSAGGHLAATAATMFGESAKLIDHVGHDDPTATLSARPDFAVLAYPVISMDRAVTHAGSRKQLIGENAAAAVEARFSAERLVTPQTPPLFIFHAEDDKTVPIANARLMADAAKAAGVPCELMVMTQGGHGFGLGNPAAESGQWFDRMFAWLGQQGIVK